MGERFRTRALLVIIILALFFAIYAVWCLASL